MGAFPEAQYTIDELKTLLGIPNPTVADKTTLMNFLKTINDQLGVDNPSTADKTTIMNYLKLLEAAMPMKNGILIPSNTELGADATTRSLPHSGAAMLIGRFTSRLDGSVRVRITMNNENPLYVFVLSLSKIHGVQYNKVVGGTISSAADIYGPIFKAQPPGLRSTIAIGTSYAADDSLFDTDGTGQYTSQLAALEAQCCGRAYFGSSVIGTINDIETPVTAGETIFILGAGASGMAGISKVAVCGTEVFTHQFG